MDAFVIPISDSPVKLFACQNQLSKIWGQVARPVVKLWLVLVIFACFAIEPAIAANCDTASGAAAVNVCKKELSESPDNIELKLSYADVLMGQRLYQQAVKILEDVLEKQPGNDKARKKYRLASSAEEQQSIKALSNDTPAAGTRNSVKEILCKSLKGQKAIKACDEVLTTDPNNVVALTRRGNELMKLNQAKKAMASYSRAAALDPTNQTLQKKLKVAQSKSPPKPKITATKVPSKKELEKIAAKKKAEKIKKQKKKAEQKRLASLEKKRKEAELKAELARKAAEVVAMFSNASLADGSTY